MGDNINTPATVYEFYGSPGAGKTYVARQLVGQCLPNSNLVSFHGQKRNHRLLVKLLSVVRHPGILSGHLLTIFRIIRLHKPRPSEFFKLFFNMSFICAMMCKASNGKALVLDQGLMQAEWSNIYHGRTFPDEAYLMKYYIQLIKQLHVGSLVVVDVKVCHGVIKSRLDSRLYGESPLDNGGNWILAQEALEYINGFTESLEKNCPAVRRVVMDNSGNGVSQGNIERIVLAKASIHP